MGGFAFVSAAAILLVLGRTLGLRVSEEEEELGLDLGEHGMKAYDLSPSTVHGRQPMASPTAATVATPILAPAMD